MEASDAKAYVQRWTAVAEIERQEQNSATIADKWRQLNAIVRLVTRLGVKRQSDDGEMEVFLVWAKLKAQYDQRHQK
jgi:hypothetical protein